MFSHLTLKVTPVECLRPAPAPLIVRAYVPSGALIRGIIVKVDVPELFTNAGLNFELVRSGNPDKPRFTVATSDPTGVMMIV